jgi:hypothetical protein
MTFKRRLKLFLIGIGIGCIAAYFFTGDRWSMAWAPEARVKLRLKTTLTKARPSAHTQLQAWGIPDVHAIRNDIDAYDIDFSDTRRTKDSMYYVMRKDSLTIVVATMRDYEKDSTATLWEVRATGH